MELILVRHGLPQRIELDAGRADPPLSETGWDQAHRVGAWLRDERIDAIYSSPMQRARDTASPYAALTGLEVNVHPDVAEYDRDASSYIPMEELKAQDYEAWRSFVEGGYGAEADMVDFRNRVVQAFEEIIARHRAQRVAVFCHGGVVNIWTTHVLGLEPKLFADVGYASISRYLCASSGQRNLHSLNETQHLVR